MYNRMLVTLDGSELSEAVLPYAVKLAGMLVKKTVLLHVHHPKDAESSPLHQTYIESKVEEIAERASAEHKGKTPKVQAEMASGHPATEILRYAEENKMDLILMATHGHSGIGRWVMGSVTSKVLQASKTPVWLVRAGLPEGSEQEMWPKGTTLVPLDGSTLAEAALCHVEALAKQLGAKAPPVVLFGACEPKIESGYYIPDPIMKPEGMKKYLTEISKRLEGAGISVKIEIRAGKAAERIIDYANKKPFNLIVMSTHGRSGLGRWVFGSVADKVIHETNRPTLLIRPR
ncbi:Universal stress protein [subsurface metagenome]